MSFLCNYIDKQEFVLKNNYCFYMRMHLLSQDTPYIIVYYILHYIILVTAICSLSVLLSKAAARSLP